jgi:hypothetical protein
LPFGLGNVVSLQDSLFDEASHWRFNPYCLTTMTLSARGA